MLAGLAHGAAGIALALSRLGVATGREEFCAAARDALAYERTLFDELLGNWPVVPPLTAPNAAPLWRCAWCHGAPGIAIARAEMLPFLPEDEAILRQEMNVALATTLRAGVGTIDHLCCGNMGRIEAGLVVARRTGETRWRELAVAGGSAIVRRAQAAGAYSLQSHPGANGAFQPGLFRGIAGIGYELLRLANLRPLPSIAAFQSL